MKWIRERDALIAQTLAFVQSVTGGKDDFQPPRGPVTAPTAATITARTSAPAEAIAVDIVPPQSLAPPQLPLTQPLRASSDFRTEMQGRIASFRKHQERFEREREEYCAATLTRLRAAIRDGALPPPARNKK